MPEQWKARFDAILYPTCPVNIQKTTEEVPVQNNHDNDNDSSQENCPAKKKTI